MLARRQNAFEQTQTGSRSTQPRSNAVHLGKINLQLRLRLQRSDKQPNLRQIHDAMGPILKVPNLQVNVPICAKPAKQTDA